MIFSIECANNIYIYHGHLEITVIRNAANAVYDVMHGFPTICHCGPQVFRHGPTSSDDLTEISFLHLTLFCFS